VTRPIKELKGFQRVTLQPVKLALSSSTLTTVRCVLERSDEARCRAGDFDIMAGAKSADLKTAVLHVEG